MNQPINQPTNQSINQSVNQSINQWINHGFAAYKQHEQRFSVCCVESN